MSKVGSVSITSIGIQSVAGRTGTPLQQQPQEPANENEREGEEATLAPESEPDTAAEPETEKQAAPPPGMGRLVDLTI
jgi:hypothetical protein